jgi:prepilin-type N-terminal cleavage/methylation domain-containing protein
MTQNKTLHTQRGFTLIELAVVMIVCGLMIGGALLTIPPFTHKMKVESTQERFDLVLNALSTYTQRHYRLPCPADSDGANRGMERNGGHCFQNTNNETLYQMTEGVIPWRELGLAESDVIDGWGRYITYKPAPQLTVDTYDTAMQSDPAGADIHNACRNQVWYDAGRNHLNRQKALFCCNSHPKTAYLNSRANTSTANVSYTKGSVPAWKQNAVVMTGTLAGTTLPATSNVASTSAWIDDYRATDSSNSALFTAGSFDNVYDDAADAPLIRASGHAVTLISHGGNGFFAFMKNTASNTRLNATMNGTAAPSTTATVSIDETRNVWPATAFAGSMAHPKSNDVAGRVAFDPLGRSTGASDDMVAYQRSDALFARSGAATCTRPARTDVPYTCPGFSYGNYIYALDNSTSMNSNFGGGKTRWQVGIEALRGSYSGAPNADNSIIAPHILSEGANDKIDPDVIGYTPLAASGCNAKDQLTLTKEGTFLNYDPLTGKAIKGIDPITGLEVSITDPSGAQALIDKTLGKINPNPATMINCTPLYHTLLESAKLVGYGSGQEPSAIMVLSDGEDNRFPSSASGTFNEIKKYSYMVAYTDEDVKAALMDTKDYAYLRLKTQAEIDAVLNPLVPSIKTAKNTELTAQIAELQKLINAGSMTRDDVMGAFLNLRYPNLRVQIVDIGNANLTKKISTRTRGDYIRPNNADELEAYMKKFNSCIGKSS